MTVDESLAVKKAEFPQDPDFNFKLDVPPLIPEGTYEVGFIRAEKKRMWGGVLKVFLWFKITNPGAHFGQNLYLACNLPKRLPTSSKYYRIWVLAAGHRPDRLEASRMSPIIFIGKGCKVLVKTVKESGDQQLLPPELHYSIIQNLIEKIAG